MAIKKGNDKEFTIPEGQEIKSARVVCKKHGDITDSVLMVSYTTTDKETNKNIKYQCGYCIPCLNEYLMKLEKAGEISSIGFIPVLGPKDELKKEGSEEVADESTEEKIEE